MAKQVQDAYIVAAVRTPVGKAPRGTFKGVRPDDLLAHSIREVLARVPSLDKTRVEDVIVGCAMPEAEQGMNVARIAGLLAGLPDSVSGVTVNRLCASGLQAVAMAADRIRLGEADVIIAGGAESMSMVPMGGHKIAINPAVFTEDRNVGIAYGMGTTAEKVAERWKIAREDQDAFALESHRRAVAATDGEEFTEIVPYRVAEDVPDVAGGNILHRLREVAADEGPRRDTSLEALAKLKPVFAAKGTVTAGNSSQTSDGAAAVLVVSERTLKQHALKPLALFRGYAVAGVPPEVMGIGPVKAVPKVLEQTGLTLRDIDWIELNEAFAAQSLAVIRDLELDPTKVNPLGGAIALGHPLGATGAIRTATIVHGLRRRKQKYGMVTMCVGVGMGAAGVFESLA
jgi:acetyl-CoA acyltransferase